MTDDSQPNQRNSLYDPNLSPNPNYKWISSSITQDLPPNAIYAGDQQDGHPMYVGRAKHNGNYLVAKIIPSRNVAYVSYNGIEIIKHVYEILVCENFAWIADRDGNVPPGAIAAGFATGTGESLYIGRGRLEDKVLLPGKVHPSHGCLYVPFGGAEYSITNYEVLVATESQTRWTGASSYLSLPPGALCGGHDSDGAPMYVGRAFHENNLLPAKVLPTKHVSYVSWIGREVPKHSFEVLCNAKVSWVKSDLEQVLSVAVPGGNTDTGEALYIGRGSYKDSLTIGRIHQDKNVLLIPYGGGEVALTEFEILVWDLDEPEKVEETPQTKTSFYPVVNKRKVFFCIFGFYFFLHFYAIALCYLDEL